MNAAKNETIIGVIADTHVSSPDELPASMLERLQNVDVIFHLGDICDGGTLKALQKIAPVVAVYGNMDEPDVRALLPEKKIMEINGHQIGLIHGWGPPKNIEDRVRKKMPDVDIILFGHSHIPLFTEKDGVFLFNPGSPTMNADGIGTFGVLAIGKTISHQIIQIEE